MKSFGLLAAAAVVAAAPQQPTSSQANYPKNNQTGESQQEAQQRAAAVKEMFDFSWAGYYKYAFPNDELLPVTNGYSNSRNGWGASAADAFSTALVMGNKEVVNEILNFVPKIDWSVSYDNEQVSLFETTIRYVAGLLSAYDLLSGPLKDLAEDQSKVPILLEQAANLANNMSYAFDTPSGVPHNGLYFNNRTTDDSPTNGLATVGSLVLEWTHLSDLTGNQTYANLTQKAESYILNPQPASSEPFPGLLGSNIAIANGSFTDDDGGFQGGDDSAYEYLIKMYVYDQSRFAEYKDRWTLAADSGIKYLASHPSSRPDLTFPAEYEGTTLFNYSQHLACFDGGMYLLGGIALKEQKYIDFGLALTESCEDTYNQTATGIGPDSFSWDTTALPANQTEFYDRAGYWIPDGGEVYVLRPEVLESFYYAYRVTGDRKWQDYSWKAIQAINATTRVGSGFSSINNVNVAGGGGFQNFQESFWFAEVLKYSYLIHAPSAIYDTNYNGSNYWVFNTEAHPFKVAGPPTS